VHRMGHYEGLVGIVGLNYHLRHALERVSPKDSKLDRTQGPSIS
jgi:hypothetical protein